MKYKLLILLFLIILVSTMHPKSLTGLYVSLYNGIQSYKYTDIDTINLDDKYSYDNLNVFLSLYKENFFEVNLSLSRDKFVDFANPEMEVKRYGIAFEVGKIISCNISKNGKKIISPDVSLGAFYRLNPVIGGKTADLYRRIIINYGLYLTIKIKINIPSKKIKINSIDIGYKHILPVFNNFYEEDYTIIDTISQIFIGISF